MCVQYLSCFCFHFEWSVLDVPGVRDEAGTNKTPGNEGLSSNYSQEEVNIV